VPAGPGTLTIQVTVRAPSWIEAKQLEVFVDGESRETRMLQETAGPGPGRLWEATVDVSATAMRPRHYVIFAAANRDGDLAPIAPGKRPFAVSNPIFF
jgi:hypothetical protein